VAVELDVPGNVWGIALPPEDWFAFPDPGPRPLVSFTKFPTVSTMAPALVIPTLREEPQKRPGPRETVATGPQPQPISRLVSNFHEQFERTVSEAAKVAVSDGTNQLLDELRAQLREDASKTLAELASANSEGWFQGALERIDGAHQALAEAAHNQWTRKIEQDLEKAGSLLDKRFADLNQMAQVLVTTTQEKHQRALEASWRDLLARFVSQLQEKVNPVLQSAQQGLTNLTKCREDSEKKIQQTVVESGNRMHELSEQLVAQFDRASRDRLATLVGDFERNCGAVITDSLGRFNSDFGAREEQAKQKLESVLQQALELMSRRMQEKATDISRRFAGELDNYCRSQFEYISGVIGELAKGFGDHSKS
jgi:RNA polymerase-interacting CarD/CdnL/TRCF family regulator